MSQLPETHPPLFGVVVLNWNNPDDTLSCLDSLNQTDPRPAYVVVVDNASSDDSLSRIRKWGEASQLMRANESSELPWLAVIESAKNRGFAGGTNLGIEHLLKHTRVTHLLLLNNDATLERTFFADIADILERHPDAGILGPTIYEHEDRTRVWYAGGVEYPWRALMQHNREVPHTEDPVETPFVTGCAMIIARNTIDRIGTLAECYFPAYWEDGDISMRARAAGIPVLYVPSAIAYHKVGATIGAAQLGVTLANANNRLRVFFVRRNYRGITKLIALAYLVVTKPARALVETLKGRPRIGWAIFSGTVSGFVSRDAFR
ncbi:MAG TPA: glycosyltransferase family 2 protein [Gemmatimonadaceae bacterium]